MAGNLDDPKELISAILEIFNLSELKRLDGAFIWKEDTWRFSAYKVSQPTELIRIDIRKKGK